MEARRVFMWQCRVVRADEGRDASVAAKFHNGWLNRENLCIRLTNRE